MTDLGICVLLGWYQPSFPSALSAFLRNGWHRPSQCGSSLVYIGCTTLRNHSSHFITRKLKQLVQGKHKLFWGWRGGTKIIKKNTCVSWKKINGATHLWRGGTCMLFADTMPWIEKETLLSWGHTLSQQAAFLEATFLGDTHTQQKNAVLEQEACLIVT